MGLTASAIAVIFSLLALLGTGVFVRQRDPILATILFIIISVSTGIVYFAMGAHVLGLVQIIIFSPVILYLIRKATVELPDPNIRRDPLPFIYPVTVIAVIVLGVILLTDLGSMILAGIFGVHFSRGSLRDFAGIIPKYFSGWSYASFLILVLVIVLAVSLVHLAREKPERKGEQQGLGHEGDEE
jgi:NADH:ubiquinone oxidoreductase subunit 6 (subunit J)